MAPHTRNLLGTLGLAVCGAAVVMLAQQNGCQVPGIPSKSDGVYAVLVRQSLNQPQWLGDLTLDLRQGEAEEFFRGEHRLDILEPDQQDEAGQPPLVYTWIGDKLQQAELPALFILDRSSHRLLLYEQVKEGETAAGILEKSRQFVK